MSDENPINAMFDALARGDVAAARATCTPDVRVWHSFDRIALDLDGIARDWQAMIDASTERGITDIRSQPTPDGIVQQHLFTLLPKGGTRKIWPVCVIARIVDGKIARLDEYIDRAGSYTSDEAILTTPGF